MAKRLEVLLPVLLGAALITGTFDRLDAQVQPAPDPQAVGVTVIAIDVRGTERVDSSAVRVISNLQEGQRVTQTDIGNAIRRLMSTGNFDDVEIRSVGDAATGARFIIEVTERPLIAGYDIEGLQRISARTVRDTVGLAGNQPLNPQVVVRTERMIRDLLAAEGVQLASLDTALVPVEGQPNTYRLSFQVEEGNRLAIAEIDIVGNQAFSADAIRGAMSTKPEGFLWFRQGRFDRNTFQEDLLFNLPSFYGSNGYIDFSVVSDTLVIDPRTGKARIVIEVDEGPQYRLGEFAIEGAQRFPNEQLERMFTSQSRTVLGLPFGGSTENERGQIFDQQALETATQRVEQLYRNEGYLYAQVDPIVQRVEGPGGDRLVDVTWAITERTPFYINRVAIQGNTYTHESVIRDRLVVFPGDVYSEDRLLQSYRSIAALGFFETPLPTPELLPNVSEGTVDLIFEVEERQTGSVNFGTSIGGGGYGRAGGLSGFIGFTQPNLFGQAKELNLQAEYGYGRSSFTSSYTDPSLFGTRNSASVSLFHTDDRYRGFSFTDGRYVRTGASLQYGFPLLNFRFTRAFAGYSLSHYRYEARNEDDCEPGNIFCQPSALASTLSLRVARDTKDHPLFPSIGTRQSLSLQQTGGPLSGDGNFQKLTGEAEWWIPVGRLGGGAPGTRPIIMTFGLRARGGAVFGNAEAFPFERFLLGGTQFGEPLRGYDESTITPFGFFSRDRTEITSAQRVGDAFLTVTGEYAIRLTDVISLSLFADAGNMWNDPASLDPTRLFRSAGIGAMLLTPFGPLGLDYAYGFDRDDGLERPGWKLHFRISQPGF